MRIMVFLFILLIQSLLVPVYGEYFGYNKVRYKNFKFEVLHTEHFDIYFYQSEKEAIPNAARMLERWHARFEKIFRFALKNQPVVIYQSYTDFAQTNVINDLISQGVGGVTEPYDRRIVVALTGVNADDDHVLGHELVHAFQFAYIQNQRNLNALAVNAFPLWFMEGMPEYLTLGGRDGLTAMWMRDVVESEKEGVPSISRIASNESRYFPYRFGHAVWAYITGIYGDSAIVKLYSSILAYGWYPGFRRALGTSFDSVSKGWQNTIAQTFTPPLKERFTPSQVGKTIIKGQGGLNLAPSISPDGNYIVFLSMRGIFTMDLYLADAQTGKILKKLTTAEINKYFETISFINSAGAWSSDSKKFAMVVLKSGRNAIAIIDVTSRRIENTITFSEVDEISQVSWSPDGGTLALSGTTGGKGHLYLYDMERCTVRTLTTGGYTDIQPSWSPDGSTIAFATDRGPRTDFDSLVFNPLRIGFIDVTTDTITTIAMNGYAKHINPQYSADGQSIYFISNPDGISNVYRYDFDTRRYSRITNVSTGVSGLTSISPALSVSRDKNILACNVFENGNYNIYEFTDSMAAGGQFPADDSAAYVDHITLPPSAGGAIIAAYLKNPAGFHPDTGFTQAMYKPSLGLLYIGQIFAGLASDNYGIGAAGGAYFVFGDLLGDHLLGLGAQINGGIYDLGGQLEYLNQSRRLNWGSAVNHIPYYSSTLALGSDTVIINNQPVPVLTTTLINQRTFDDALNLFTQYPFSINRRMEAGIGYTRYSFMLERQFTAFTGDGSIVQQTVTNPPPPSPLHLFNAYFAYIGDYSYNGFTAPLSGRRYHYEIDPTIGSLQYAMFTGDYRQYYFLKPVTFAFRALHVGRYGKDSDNDQLSELFLGYPTLVRGYGLGSFDFVNCTNDSTGDCAVFNRINGSRIGIGNVELRLPLLGTRQLGLVEFRYLPTDLLAFVDGGVAWTNADGPVLQLKRVSNRRIPVFSAGAGVRFNILGLIALQIYYVYPFQRPDKGAFFDFEIAPGW